MSFVVSLEKYKEEWKRKKPEISYALKKIEYF
jgi:hypothetical protein